jgi:acetyl-CoA carboxylase carboxyltransferase component
MAAKQAVGIISRREIAASEDPDGARDALAAEYGEQHLGAELAAREGFIDEVIEPRETRDRLAWAIASLPKPRRRNLAGNIPL